jgi:hypothetical protein
MRRLLPPVAIAALICAVPALASAGPPGKSDDADTDEDDGDEDDGDEDDADADEADDEKAGGKKITAKDIKKRTKGNFGLGLFIPNPIALTGKAFVRPQHALQFGIGYAGFMSPDGTVWQKDGTFRAHFDYAWHTRALASNQALDLMIFVGVGVGAGFYIVRMPHPDTGDPQVRARPLAFLRLPVAGLTIHWQRVPMDTFIEASWTPALVWTPAPRGDIKYADFGLGFRYYF